MICPHCGKNINVLLRKPTKRTEYWQARHIASGKAKVRTSIEQIGVCIGTDKHKCSTRTQGRRQRCDQCRREMLRDKYFDNKQAVTNGN